MIGYRNISFGSTLVLKTKIVKLKFMLRWPIISMRCIFKTIFLSYTLMV